jgi:hypothetical protein
VILTKAAEAVLNRLLPQVEASAGSCGCHVYRNTCEGGFWTEHLYRKVTDYYGQCTIWTAFCFKRRTDSYC